MKNRLSHLFMKVGDLEAAKDFWGKLVGLDIIQDHGAYVQVGGNTGFEIGLEEGEVPESPAGSIEINIQVEDVNAVYGDLLAAGVTSAEEPTTSDWGTVYAVVLDPDGRRIGIQSW
ncbi:MAG: hypothetical protein HKN07_09075 [Acidimicrobiia bacterium]|nr:hypothetical protein [Acidimicrobiia bacterium]